MDKKSAFSLVELMVAVGIVGVLVTLAVPRYHQFMVQARRGEAKSNLSHIATLQETYKVDHFSYYSGAAMSGTNGIGYRDGSGYDGSCDDPATDVDEGINNHLGFRPNGCGQLRYFYQLRNSGNTAVASAASDAKGRHIYPDCSGGGAPECGYASGDAVLLAMNSGKSEVCRNITNYCPGSSTTPTPPPTICPLNDEQNDCTAASGTWAGTTCTCGTGSWSYDDYPTCNGSCSTTTPPCPIGETMMGGQCCASTLQSTYNSCIASGETWQSDCTCTTTPPCPTGESMMGGQCCASTLQSTYTSCIASGETWQSDCSCCTCTPSSADPLGLSAWTYDLSLYWPCESIPRTRREYIVCTPATDACYSHYGAAEHQTACGTKGITCANRCTGWQTSWNPCAETSLGTWEETGTKTRTCSNPCSVSEGSCPSSTPTYCATSVAATPEPCTPDPRCTDNSLVTDAKQSCENQTGKRFDRGSADANGRYDCECYEYCDKLDSKPYATNPRLSEAKRNCDGKHGNFAKTVNAGEYDCTCTLACVSSTEPDGTLVPHIPDTNTNNFPTVAQTESLCSHQVGGALFTDDYFEHTSGIINDKCKDDTANAVPYRFTRDRRGKCKCTAPIEKNAHCVGGVLVSMIDWTQYGGSKFKAADKDELPACYKPCLSETTLDERKLCYATHIYNATSNGIVTSGQTCEAMRFYNSYNYETTGHILIEGKKYDCRAVEATLDTMKNNMSSTRGGVNCDTPEYIWIQATSSISP